MGCAASPSNVEHSKSWRADGERLTNEAPAAAAVLSSAAPAVTSFAGTASFAALKDTGVLAASGFGPRREFGCHGTGRS